MSTGAAEPAAARRRGLAPARSRPRGLALPALGRPALAVVGGSVLLAALSLVLVPSNPAYDSWSWLVWGREILHGTLSTADGPSWKPFPVLFTAPLALFGSAAPALWLLVARAGALLAAVFAYRLSRRLAGGGLIGAGAGVLGALALVFSTGYLGQPAVGYSEGLLVLGVLLSTELHLDGRRRGALAAGAVVGLLRPETWLFWGLYALWLARRDPGSRRLALALGLGMLALWIVPEWLGSGNPLRAGVRASEPERNSLAFAAHPASAVITTARTALMGWARAAVLAAVVVGGLAASRGRSARAVRLLLWIVAAAVALDMVVALMTWAGFAGNPRYLMASTALLGVAGAAAAGLLARSLAARSRALATVLCAGLALVAGVEVAHRTRSLSTLEDSLSFQAGQRHDLARVIAAAGGRRRLLGCGALAAEKYARPLVAWTLGTRITDVHLEPQERGFLFVAQAARDAYYTPPSLPPSVRIADAGPWRVLARGCD